MSVSTDPAFSHVAVTGNIPPGAVNQIETQKTTYRCNVGDRPNAVSTPMILALGGIMVLYLTHAQMIRPNGCVILASGR